MTPPAQDAGESLFSRQQFPQTPQVTPEPSDDFINFYKMTSKPRGKAKERVLNMGVVAWAMFELWG